VKHIYGLRTLIAGLFGMVVLLAGLWLLAKDHRHEAYFAFATGIGCIIGALAAKSVGATAVGGDGIKGGVANLLTSKKPGEP
jgi:hypothetical protein